MFAGDIEMVNNVSEEIAVLHDEHAWLHLEFEIEAALVAFGARLHADFHDAFAHRRLVAKTRDVANGVDHCILVTAPMPTLRDSRSRFGGWSCAPERKDSEC